MMNGRIGRAMTRSLVVVAIAAAMLTACGGGGDDAEPTVSSVSTSPPTTTTTTTTTVEATDGSVTLAVTYDGETCTSAGPEVATLDDEITLTFMNDSDEVVYAFLALMPPDRVGELKPLVETGFEYSEETSLRPATVVLQPPAGSEQTSSTFLAVNGIYILDCTRFVDGNRSYTWWPASLEVTS